MGICWRSCKLCPKLFDWLKISVCHIQHDLKNDPPSNYWSSLICKLKFSHSMQKWSLKLCFGVLLGYYEINFMKPNLVHNDLIYQSILGLSYIVLWNREKIPRWNDYLNHHSEVFLISCASYFCIKISFQPVTKKYFPALSLNVIL